jgi:hypothetical protein
MKNKGNRPRCMICKRQISGTQHRWGSLQKTCEHCYSSLCKGFITRRNLEKKIRTQMATLHPGTRRRRFLSWLFG